MKIPHCVIPLPTPSKIHGNCLLREGPAGGLIYCALCSPNVAPLVYVHFVHMKYSFFLVRGIDSFKSGLRVCTVRWEQLGQNKEGLLHLHCLIKELQA